MKKIEMAKLIGLADEKYVAEAAPKAKVTHGVFWRKFAIIAACISLVLTSVGLWLFVPYQKAEIDGPLDRNNLPTELREYSDSEYLDLMYAFYQYNGKNVRTPDNNYEKYVEDVLDNVFGAFMTKSESADGDYYYNSAPTLNADDYFPIQEAANSSLGDKNYVETTDNQVAGVIEADLFKRTKTHIFYLDYTEMVIRVYSVAGEDSRLVSKYQLTSKDDAKFAMTWSGQLFLSEDGKTLTFISNNSDVISYDTITKKESLSAVSVISLDVSDPENISEKARFEITGSFITARYVGNKILLMSKFNANSLNYSELGGFVPQINTGDGFEPVAAEDIIFPEEITSKLYTVVTQLDGDSLEFEGAAACLGYSTEVYVSADKVFLTKSYDPKEAVRGEKDGVLFTRYPRMTEILALGYGEEGFKNLGSVSVEGTVKNQYSLDEYGGILRVVTTLSSNNIYFSEGEINVVDGVLDMSNVVMIENASTNAALYCIDIETFEVVAEVSGFAPDGESVESVRFDGTKAYVCTAEVITFTDPVYFFDLSDMSNITYTDTGVIEGYSSSLVDFGENTLLGIGYGDNRSTLKIEVYAEDGNKVESLCAYEKAGFGFSEDYKSYFIDRENGLVGLAVSDQTTGNLKFRYILLAYNGYELVEVENVLFDGYIEIEFARAALADGYFYVMARDLFEFFKVFE
ncbi:MAG: beta-propeller domain-containing protein [Clostridia bacterium]|nr:beta-propeller domain-containing protein [Clostridia bacterium]